MTDVTLPDGSVASFPDNIADNDILSAVQSHLDTQQMGGPMRLPAMAGSYLAKGALEGAGAIGDLQDLIGTGVKKYLFDPVNNAARNALGVEGDFSPRMVGNPLNSASLVGLGRSVGAVDRPDLTPQTTGERYLAAGAEGAGGTLPYLPLAGGSAAINAARGVAQGAAGGAVGEAGAQMFPDHPDLARATGNVIGALTAGGGLNAANRIAGAYTGTASPMLEAYRALGVTPTLAGDVTGSPTLQMIQAYAARSPGGAGRMHAASEHAVDQFGNALENTASNLGASRTAQEAGEALQQQARDWLDQFRSASRQAWGQVDQQIPANTPVGLTNYGATLAAVRNQMPNAPATAGVLQPKISGNLLDSLIQDTQNGPLTWQDAKGIRTRVGEMLSDPQLVSDTSHADLKRIYGALSTDLEATAAAQGPAAQAAFDQANALTRNGHGFVENVLSKVIRGNQITPEQAANTALNTGGAGGTMLGQIRQQMPTAADELAAYKLRDMGLANTGQQNSTGARISPGTFVTDRAKLSPEATNALFGGYPDQLQALADVAGSMKNTERFLNTSNTGTHTATGHAVAGLAAAAPAAIEGYHLGGIPGAAASLAGAIAAPFVPSYIAGRITSNPTLTRLLAASPAVSPQSSGLLTRAATFPALARALAGGP